MEEEYQSLEEESDSGEKKNLLVNLADMMRTMVVDNAGCRFVITERDGKISCEHVCMGQGGNWVDIVGDSKMYRHRPEDAAVDENVRPRYHIMEPSRSTAATTTPTTAAPTSVRSKTVVQENDETPSRSVSSKRDKSRSPTDPPNVYCPDAKPGTPPEKNVCRFGFMRRLKKEEGPKEKEETESDKVRKELE